MKEKHDILTGLFNRRAYEYEIQHLESLGYGAIIFFDVDDFKKINDQFGHQYGDQCLSTIAGLILKSFQASDFVTGSAATNLVYYLIKQMKLIF